MSDDFTPGFVLFVTAMVAGIVLFAAGLVYVTAPDTPVVAVLLLALGGGFVVLGLVVAGLVAWLG